MPPCLVGAHVSWLLELVGLPSGCLHRFPRVRNEWNTDTGEGFAPVACASICVRTVQTPVGIPTSSPRLCFCPHAVQSVSLQSRTCGLSFPLFDVSYHSTVIRH